MFMSWRARKPGMHKPRAQIPNEEFEEGQYKQEEIMIQ